MICLTLKMSSYNQNTDNYDPKFNRDYKDNINYLKSQNPPLYSLLESSISQTIHQFLVYYAGADVDWIKLSNYRNSLGMNHLSPSNDGSILLDILSGRSDLYVSVWCAANVLFSLGHQSAAAKIKDWLKNEMKNDSGKNIQFEKTVSKVNKKDKLMKLIDLINENPKYKKRYIKFVNDQKKELEEFRSNQVKKYEIYVKKVGELIQDEMDDEDSILSEINKEILEEGVKDENDKKKQKKAKDKQMLKLQKMIASAKLDMDEDEESSE